jgi:CIC family chloride channel protein
LALALLALLVGTLAGLIGAIFRLSLREADSLRNAIIASAHGQAAAGFFLVLLGASPRPRLVRLAPSASGSGITHVEAVLRGKLPLAPFRLVPVKFFGGLLAIGTGRALGPRARPSRWERASSILWEESFSRTWPDCRVLIAAGAGAGLATAFNPPIAASIFVQEELVQRFEHRIAIAALGASAAATAVARVLLGDAPCSPTRTPRGGRSTFVFGALAGFLAVAYNRALLAALAAARLGAH